MKISKIITVLFTLVAISLMGTSLAQAVDLPPLYGVGALFAISSAPQVITFISYKIGQPVTWFNSTGGKLLYVGISPEIWLAEVMEDFRPNTSFISEARNLDAWVNANSINLAEAGADPEVLENNTIFPIPMAQRADTPFNIALDTHDTLTTVVQNLEQIEASYDKMASVVAGHKESLRKRAGLKAAYKWSPSVNGAYSPVLDCTGATFNGLKMPQLEDIVSLDSEMNKKDFPMGRTLVLDPYHYAALVKEDMKLFKNVLTNGGMLFNFKMFVHSNNPVYHKTTGAKAAYRAAATANDAPSSIIFVNSEVGVAIGDYEVFAQYKCPDVKGDKINFQQRILMSTLRSKAFGALKSVAA